MLAAIRHLSFRWLPQHSVLRIQAFRRPVFVPALAFVSFLGDGPYLCEMFRPVISRDVPILE